MVETCFVAFEDVTLFTVLPLHLSWHMCFVLKDPRFAGATTADLDAAYPRTLLRFRCSYREHTFVFLWTCLFKVRCEQSRVKSPCLHRNQQEHIELSYLYWGRNLSSSRVLLLRIQSTWLLNMYSSILLYPFDFKRTGGSASSPPSGVNMCS